MSCGCSKNGENKSWDFGLGNLFKTELKETKKKIVGGRVTMPSEYYGRDSNRYNSCQTKLEPSAYGPNFGTSHGTLISVDNKCGLSIIGPDLGPAPYATTTQTGGGGKRRSSKRKMKRSKKRSNKKRMTKRK
jgi:hypothetical protein